MEMTEDKFASNAERFIAAWNSQDVEKVVASYAEDVVYVDPNTRGEVKGAEAMRRYLSKLFAAWEMHWAIRSVHPLKDTNGAVVRWHATIKRAGGKGEMVEVDGMDLVILEGDRVKRNEVYFDRAVLAPLMS
jgi:steroid delta-isomerase-like uncharacterized protein